MPAPLILLVNPWIYDFAAYDLWSRPTGLLMVAAHLKQHGCEVHLLDCLDTYHPAMKEIVALAGIRPRAYGQGRLFKQHIPRPKTLASIPRQYSRYGMPPDIFLKVLQSMPRPDAVLVGSMMTYWYPAVHDAIVAVKEVFPDVPVLLGGIYATLCPGHAERTSGADAVVRGPFSTAALHLLEKAIKKELAPVAGEPSPGLACDLLSSKKVIPLLTSLGCPLNCPYCASKLLQPDFKQRDPRAIAAEIEHWHSAEGATDFAFYDDALLINKDAHVAPLLQAIIERKLPVRFHVPNGLHVRSIDDRIADLMKQSGFATLRLGLETADPQVGHATGNKASRDDFARAARALRAAGFTDRQAGAYILAGLPKQSVRSVRESIAFVRAHWLRPYITEYSPIPGTAFWLRAVASSPFPLGEEPLFHNNSLLPCRSEAFTPEDLETLKRESRNTAAANGVKRI